MTLINQIFIAICDLSNLYHLLFTTTYIFYLSLFDYLKDSVIIYALNFYFKINFYLKVLIKFSHLFNSYHE